MSSSGSLKTAVILAAGAFGIACGSSDDGGGGGPSFEFEPYEGRADDPDVLTERLCPASADPEAAEEKVFVDCELEGGNFAPVGVEPKLQLTVMTYNMERGLKLDEQLAAFESGTLPTPDVLLVSEVDRGCSRSESRNVPRDVAKRLGMNYVFAVEFVELPRAAGSGGQITETCEHGNAVFSRYPIGNVGSLRHTENKSWYAPPGSEGEPRLGGRVLVWADVKVGDRYLHAYSLHFESSPADNEIQIAQATETAELAGNRPFTAVVAGDTNAPFYFIDLQSGNEPTDGVTQAFFTRGWVDAHAPLDASERGTRGGFVIDLILANEDVFSDPAICAEAACGDLSDHLPVWTTVKL